MIFIAPSILSSDFGQLNAEVASIEPYSDYLHIDVMDGHFVNNLSFGAPVLKCIKTKLPTDCHLMVSNPEDRIQEFVDAGAHNIIFHIEAAKDAVALTREIQTLGVKAGISLRPATPLKEIEPVLDIIDSVLIMTVEPGFGGQSFMEDQLDKIKTLRERKPDLLIEVDGGINEETAKKAVSAGANCLIAGNYIFKAEDRGGVIESLRGGEF